MRIGYSIVTVSLFVILTASYAQAGTVTNYQTQGNLEVTHAVGCKGFSELSNQYTPADLYKGLSECWAAKKYNEAAELFILAGVYGRFDSLRVADISAHQATSILSMEALHNLTPEQKTGIMSAMQQHLTKDTPQLLETCNTVRHIGMPDYHPSYMIQHGMKAFSGKQPNDGLVVPFDAKGAWEQSLYSYLHCPK